MSEAATFFYTVIPASHRDLAPKIGTTLRVKTLTSPAQP
jgi:hypothetical protein